jgi:hypothetical protein
MGIRSRIDCESATYSASLVDRVIGSEVLITTEVEQHKKITYSDISRTQDLVHLQHRTVLQNPRQRDNQSEYIDVDVSIYPCHDCRIDSARLVSQPLYGRLLVHVYTIQLGVLCVKCLDACYNCQQGRPTGVDTSVRAILRRS